MSGDPAHAGTVLRLADYARRRLDPAGQAEVAAHLLSCPECREMLEAYNLMEAVGAKAVGAKAAGSAGTHLTGAAIAALAVPGAVSAPAPDEARHLGGCRDCADELRLARAANDAAPASGSASVTRWLLPLAAALAIAFLGLATIRAWRQSGSLATRLATLENDNAALQSKVADLSRADNPADHAAPEAGGAVSYLFLRGTVRGAAGVERLTLDPDQRSVYLALAVEIPAGARHRGEDGRVALLGADGQERWSSAIPAGEIDGIVARGDSLLVRIPAAILEPGRQEIRLTAAAPVTGPAPGTGARVWFRSAFEISGPGRSR